jgi:hypothetical protein
MEVPGITDAISLNMTAFGSCAVTRRGNVLCWGKNDVGQVGRGTISAYREDPMEVTGLGTAGVASVVVGFTFSCALMRDGVVSAGAETLKGTRQRYDDQQPRASHGPEPSESRDLEVTERAACAATPAGGVKCWGEGGGLYVSYDMTPRTQATDVSDLTSGVSTVSIGVGVGMARMVDGAVKTRGANGWFQTGQGSTANKGFQPAPIRTTNGPSTDRHLRVAHEGDGGGRSPPRRGAHVRATLGLGEDRYFSVRVGTMPPPDSSG